MSSARRDVRPVREDREREEAELRDEETFRDDEAERAPDPRIEPAAPREEERVSAPRPTEAERDLAPAREPLAVFVREALASFVRELPVVLPGRPAEAGESVVLRTAVVAPLRIPEPRDGDGFGVAARWAVVAPRRMERA